jgi:hypothetical protein
MVGMILVTDRLNRKEGAHHFVKRGGGCVNVTGYFQVWEHEATEAIPPSATQLSTLERLQVSLPVATGIN